MNSLIIFALVGTLGGTARACYGLLKSFSSGKQAKPRDFITTVILAAIIGALIGWVVETDYKVAAAAGYAGTDFIQNLAGNMFKGNMTIKSK